MTGPRTHLPQDWYSGGLPANIKLGENVFIDTSYCFGSFLSRQKPGLIIGDAAGIYDRSALVVGPNGRITIGDYTCLNATYLVCSQQITIGAHCLLAWGVVVTDTWVQPETPTAARHAALSEAARDSERPMPAPSPPRPVVLEDNVWVGFDSVVLPGVTVGRGSVVGCRTVIREDVPPYAVVTGDPVRVIRTLEPDDDEETRQRLLLECVRDSIAGHSTPPDKG